MPFASLDEDPPEREEVVTTPPPPMIPESEPDQTSLPEAVETPPPSEDAGEDTTEFGAGIL